MGQNLFSMRCSVVDIDTNIVDLPLIGLSVTGSISCITLGNRPEFSWMLLIGLGWKAWRYI